MKIAVCIKQVPVVSLLKFDNETRRVVRDGVPSEVNPFDVLGMSLAVNLKQDHDAEVVVYTMGPPQARDALVQCLAMGADSAVHLNDRAFAGSDTLATARALALALARDEYDLIICGRNSVDAETGQVGAEIAEMLDLPQVSGVRHLELDVSTDGSASLTAERITDEGHDVVRCARCRRSSRLLRMSRLRYILGGRNGRLRWRSPLPR
ncbi:Electron transfer flavoprotein subunit beta [Geodia barretti]|uniref:Electron transfer flavoprotein subunit beta n=1 Tax=Geodia barretti TaxID=519541 RepID=A0AA35RCE8_GEOBA|nr:Electron transfer flavoprotein subunit beta [Geodia barretti]